MSVNCTKAIFKCMVQSEGACRLRLVVSDGVVCVPLNLTSCVVPAMLFSLSSADSVIVFPGYRLVRRKVLRLASRVARHDSRDRGVGARDFERT